MCVSDRMCGAGEWPRGLVSNLTLIFRDKSCFALNGYAVVIVFAKEMRRTRSQTVFVHKKITRSSAQGNCSANSLAASVMSSILPCFSILPCPPCLPPVMLSRGGGSSHRGGSAAGEVWVGGWGSGAGDISSTLPCTALPHGASAQRDFA